MQKESDFYPLIARFLKKRYHCFATGVSMGCGHVGRADIVGLRDIGGATMPNVEIIAVEVKWDTGNFCKNLGQALGYSLFGNKCYLAVALGRDRNFTLEQREMATHLGVGLLECGGKDIHEAVTSGFHDPIPSLWMRVLWNLDYVICSICGNAIEAPENRVTKSLERAKEEGRVFYVDHRLSDDGNARKLLFTERSRKERHRAKYSYVCMRCLQSLELL